MFHSPLSVSIIGCGWLGFPLAVDLIGKGCLVLGTTTSQNKMDLFGDKGIKPYLFDASKDALPHELLQTNALVLAYPPRTRHTNGEWYWQSVERIMAQVNQSALETVVLLSSTSVYPDLERTFTEEYPLSEANTGNRSIYMAEQCVLVSEKGSVLRLGGLAGADRLLARHFAGKDGLKNGNAPTNLLHQQDGVESIAYFLANKLPRGIYNICSPVHPTKKELYTQDCMRFGMPLPLYEEENGTGKIISSQKIMETGFSFSYPDPLGYGYDFV